VKYEPNIKVKGVIKTDLKDRKILRYLEENSRESYGKIAKKVGLSKDSVRYRIKKLEDQGVIQNYKVVVDLKGMNYWAYHLFVRLNNPKTEIEEQYIKKLIKYPFVRAVIKFNGGYDYEIAMVAKNLDELETNMTKLYNGVDKYIQEGELLISVRPLVSRVLPQNFIDFEVKLKRKKKREVKIEEKDLKILKVMSNNANIPTYSIAKKVGLSPETVSYHLKKMEEGGFIIKYVPAINYGALGYQVYAVLLRINSLYEDIERDLQNHLIEDKNTLWATKTIGKYNLMVYVCTKNVEELHETLNKIRDKFSERIKEYETLIAYEEYKYSYFPELFLGE